MFNTNTFSENCKRFHKKVITAANCYSEPCSGHGDDRAISSPIHNHPSRQSVLQYGAHSMVFMYISCRYKYII